MSICVFLETGPVPDPKTCSRRDEILVVFKDYILGKARTFYLSGGGVHWYDGVERLDGLETPIEGWCWVIKT